MLKQGDDLVAALDAVRAGEERVESHRQSCQIPTTPPPFLLGDGNRLVCTLFWKILTYRLPVRLYSLWSSGYPSLASLGCHLPEGVLPLAPPGVNNPGNYRLVRNIYLRIFKL